MADKSQEAATFAETIELTDRLHEAQQTADLISLRRSQIAILQERLALATHISARGLLSADPAVRTELADLATWILERPYPTLDEDPS